MMWESPSRMNVLFFNLNDSKENTTCLDYRKKARQKIDELSFSISYTILGLE